VEKEIEKRSFTKEATPRDQQAESQQKWGRFFHATKKFGKISWEEEVTKHRGSKRKQHGKIPIREIEKDDRGGIKSLLSLLLSSDATCLISQFPVVRGENRRVGKHHEREIRLPGVEEKFLERTFFREN